MNAFTHSVHMQNGTSILPRSLTSLIDSWTPSSICCCFPFLFASCFDFLQLSHALVRWWILPFIKHDHDSGDSSAVERLSSTDSMPTASGVSYQMIWSFNSVFQWNEILYRLIFIHYDKMPVNKNVTTKIRSSPSRQISHHMFELMLQAVLFSTKRNCTCSYD